jgi:hypothetical protein
LSGKLDLKALPDPQWQQDAYRAPRTPAEHTLCQLVAAVLSTFS